MGSRLAARIAGSIERLLGSGSTTSLFVFAFGAALSFFYPGLGREQSTARELMQKGAAAILVAVGVILVTR